MQPNTTYREIDVTKLVTDKSFMIRQTLDPEAIKRYQELLRDNGKCPALKIQKDTLKVIDGWHRLQAAKQEDIKKIGCEILDVPDEELRALAYKFNRKHGVPISAIERNTAITEMYIKDGKTQEQIAEIVNLSQQRVGQLLASTNTSNTNIEVAREKQISIIRLVLKGDTQEKIAETFGITHGYVSQIKTKYFDSILKAYRDEKLLKRQIAERVGLKNNEIDQILQEFGDPINFKPQETTLWPSFGIDDRFGQRHPGNIPGDLVRNILCRLTKPGDLILDPFAGGGVVVDVCKDMVNRSCEAFDLNPVKERDDIIKHDILTGPPPTSRDPDLIFLDPPYGPQKEGEYSKDDNDLANMPVETFCEKMEHIFGYWTQGWLVCLMTVYTKDGLGNYVHLPAEMNYAMEKAGWRFSERIINQIGRAAGTTGKTVSRLEKANWWTRRDELDILIGRKKV